MTDQPETAERPRRDVPFRNIPYPTPELSPSAKQESISSPDTQPASALKRRRTSPESAPGPEHDLGNEQRFRRSKRRRTDDRPAAIPDGVGASRRSPLPSTTRSRAPKSSKPLTKRKSKHKPRVVSDHPSTHTTTSRRRAVSNPLPHTVPPLSAPSELDWYSRSFDESTFSLATPPPVGTPLDPTEELEVTVSSIAPLPSPPSSVSHALQVTHPVESSRLKVVDITPAEGESAHHIAFPSSSPLLERHDLPIQNLDWIKVGELVTDHEQVAQDPISLLFSDAD